MGTGNNNKDRDGVLFTRSGKDVIKTMRETNQTNQPKILEIPKTKHTKLLYIGRSLTLVIDFCILEFWVEEMSNINILTVSKVSEPCLLVVEAVVSFPLSMKTKTLVHFHSHY